MSVQVAGIAKIGDVVTYSDVFNQDGEQYEVLYLQDEARDYALYSLSDKGIIFSDLRQNGWTFVS